MTHIGKVNDTSRPEEITEGVDVYASSHHVGAATSLDIVGRSDTGALSYSEPHRQHRPTSEQSGLFHVLQRTAVFERDEIPAFEKLWSDLEPPGALVLSPVELSTLLCPGFATARHIPDGAERDRKVTHARNRDA